MCVDYNTSPPNSKGQIKLRIDAVCAVVSRRATLCVAPRTCETDTLVQMEWQQLLSQRRVACGGAVSEPQAEPARSVFERDWDRILFSSAFRRMHDKTQVFPLPEDDVVHSRLTHSLEVASVGRSLGNLVGLTLQERIDTVRPNDVADIVAAAALAHDIGNPPFGHAGEDAIAEFFRSDIGKRALGSLSESEKRDFTAFEGNAQGFRLLTRLQLESDNGLHLTAATLAAFTKYPRISDEEVGDATQASRKKHGVLQADISTFAAVCRETGLIERIPGKVWARHPLAFLVEAADDICYSILDIEDGVRLQLVPYDEAAGLLQSLSNRVEEDRLARLGDPRSKIGYLRAMAIGALINECGTAFVENESAMRDGSFDKSLAKVIPSKDKLKKLRDLAREKCYRAPGVIEIELAGYEALGGLLAHFVPPAMVPSNERDATLTERQQKAVYLLHQRGVRTDAASLYERLVRVTDYVSGMTDRHALAVYRRLKGIAIPGRPA